MPPPHPFSPNLQEVLVFVEAMRRPVSAALLGLSLLFGSYAARSPVQLEALRREVIETHGAERAAAARFEEAASSVHERDSASEKRAPASTISFANPAAAGTSFVIRVIIGNISSVELTSYPYMNSAHEMKHSMCLAHPSRMSISTLVTRGLVSLRIGRLCSLSLN